MELFEFFVSDNFQFYNIGVYSHIWHWPNNDIKNKHVYILDTDVICVTGSLSTLFYESVFFPHMLLYFPLLNPTLVISLFSRTSVFCSGWRRVLDTIAFATTWTGTAMEVEQTAETAPKNFRITHSPGRLSRLSTNKTLFENKTQLRDNVGFSQVL